MRQTTGFALAVLVVCGMFAAVPPAAAQSVDVTPSVLDFGDVDVGTSGFATFRVLSTEPIPLTVEQFRFLDDPSDPFFFDGFVLNGTDVLTGVPPSVLMYEGEFLDVTLRFTPLELGLFETTLRMTSDAEPPDRIFNLSVMGRSVDSAAAPEPATLLLISIALASVGYRWSRARQAARQRTRRTAQ
ncbi:MAG: hypothetical protein QNJ91_12380 [Gammaproteobacteria bacterium]|nr:hypothetical protein [Gammaproteobacteria bacterium]